VLDKIAKEFKLSFHVKKYRHYLHHYKQSFRGSALVSWLLARGYGQNRPHALAIGQHMFSAHIFRPVPSQSSSHFFQDNSQLYSFMKKKQDSEQDEEIESLDPSIHSGHLLLKGMQSYYRVFLVVKEKNKKMYLFRTEKSPEPMIWFNLAKAECQLAELERDKTNSDTNSEGGSTTNLGLGIGLGIGGTPTTTLIDPSCQRQGSEIGLSDHVFDGRGKQSSTEISDISEQSQNSEEGNSGGTKPISKCICYMLILVRNRKIVFRMESDEDRLKWMRAMVCCQVPFKKWDLIQSQKIDCTTFY